MDDNNSSYGESIFSGRSPSSSNTSIIPPRGDEIDRWQRHIGMQDFAKDLQRAAKSLYPNHNRSRYSNVYVLILKWKTEDPKLPVWCEIEELYDVLDRIYGYEIEIFEIPDHKSHAKVVEKITAFIAINDDSKNDLKIVYYAGHSRLSDTRDLVWSSYENSTNQKCSTVTYTGIQHSLEQADSDVLILLDSCSSGIGDGGEGHGVTELMAACAFDTIANGVGHYSFTKALTTELRLLSKKKSFPVVELYKKVYCRAQHHMPQGIKNERYPAPILLPLTRDDLFPRSIQLSVQERPSAQNQMHSQGLSQNQTPITEHGVTKRQRDHDMDTISNKRPCLGSEEGLLEDSMDCAPGPPETSQTAVQLFQEEFEEPSTVLPGLKRIVKKNSSVPSGLQFTALQCSRDAPRLLFSIRLQENIKAEDLSVEYFTDWLRIIPAIAKEVTIEGIFKSDSTLLLLGLPFSLWPYLSPHPAVVNLGPIRSLNILIRERPFVFNFSKEPFDFVTIDDTKPIDLDFTVMGDDNDMDLWGEVPGTYSEMTTEQESIFDAISLPALSSEGGPQSAPSSRRQGRLYPLAEAGTKSAEMVEAGPCWRCKFLRKRCGISNPCLVCPPPGPASSWATVGCRRGSLVSEMPPLELCPIIRSKGVSQYKIRIEREIKNIDENCFWMDRIRTRTLILTASYVPWMEARSGRICLIETQPQLFDLWLNSCYSRIPSVQNPALTPVKECILDIIWEVMENSWIEGILLREDVIDSIKALIHLLWQAAQYQISIETDDLIPHSLRCLRSALEAIVIKKRYKQISHHSCNATTCSINCISDLDYNITNYLDEYSRVFFLKENYGNIERWWLSVFYSLCIQGMVRKILMELVKSSITRSRENTTVNEYLYLPVQLFIAGSGSYNPLAEDSPLGGSREKDQAIISARKAVRQEIWKESGISGSSDYLKRLFGQSVQYSAAPMYQQDSRSNTYYSPQPDPSGIETDVSKRKAVVDTSSGIRTPPPLGETW